MKFKNRLSSLILLSIVSLSSNGYGMSSNSGEEYAYQNVALSRSIIRSDGSSSGYGTDNTGYDESNLSDGPVVFPEPGGNEHIYEEVSPRNASNVFVTPSVDDGYEKVREKLQLPIKAKKRGCGWKKAAMAIGIVVAGGVGVGGWQVGKHFLAKEVVPEALTSSGPAFLFSTSTFPTSRESFYSSNRIKETEVPYFFSFVFYGVDGFSGSNMRANYNAKINPQSFDSEIKKLMYIYIFGRTTRTDTKQKYDIARQELKEATTLDKLKETLKYLIGTRVASDWFKNLEFYQQQDILEEYYNKILSHNSHNSLAFNSISSEDKIKILEEELFSKKFWLVKNYFSHVDRYGRPNSAVGPTRKKRELMHSNPTAFSKLLTFMAAVSVVNNFSPPSTPMKELKKQLKATERGVVNRQQKPFQRPEKSFRGWTKRGSR